MNQTESQKKNCQLSEPADQKRPKKGKLSAIEKQQKQSKKIKRELKTKAEINNMEKKEEYLKQKRKYDSPKVKQYKKIIYKLQAQE